MGRVFVTGASGRLGANLVRRLIADGHRVVAQVLPNDPQARKLSGMALDAVVEADLRDGSAILHAARGCDAIIHTAALMNERSPGVSRSDFFGINVVGTFNVFQAAVDVGAERVVYVSSTAAYCVYSAKPQPLTETQPLTPTGLYGVTKAVNERLGELLAYSSGLRVVTLRPNYIVAGAEPLDPWTAGVVVGQIRQWSKDPRSALYVPEQEEPWRDVEAQIKAPSDLVVPRDPAGVSWRWHLCDVRDCVEACVRALHAPESCLGKAYNVVGPDPADWDVVVPYIAEKTGREWYEVQVPRAWRFWFDLTAAEQELGFKPQYDITRMIDDALRFRAGEDIGVIPSTL
ncbi:MAG: NAD(P)-dependent oxidoreductase [Armatimonadetes bacterium]|nr:NAD(P)-dependent oxidoreductase [Armatimonadota bacterium]